MTYEEDSIFEDEVRRIARHLWPESEFSGSKLMDGQERDGVFFTEDCIHIVEATTSRKLDKARKDITKSVKLATKLQKYNPTKVVKCWFVTQNEPTADQRKFAERYTGRVVVISFSQFQGRIVKAKSYLSLDFAH